MSSKIYLIRHGEKPPKLPNGEDADGLSAQGLERAQALPKVFGRDTVYNIKYIIAEHPKKDGSRTRPYLTILPLATSLSIEPNTSIDRDDASTVASTAKSYVENDDGNVLICWEHGVLGKVVKELGVKHKVEYPGDRFDVIWLVEEPWKELVVVGSEGVEGLDDKWVGVGEGGVGPVLGGGEEEKD